MCVLTFTPPDGAPNAAGLAEDPPGATEDWEGEEAGALDIDGCNEKQTRLVNSNEIFELFLVIERLNVLMNCMVSI